MAQVQGCHREVNFRKMMKLLKGTFRGLVGVPASNSEMLTGRGSNVDTLPWKELSFSENSLLAANGVLKVEELDMAEIGGLELGRIIEEDGALDAKCGRKRMRTTKNVSSKISVKKKFAHNLSKTKLDDDDLGFGGGEGARGFVAGIGAETGDGGSGEGQVGCDFMQSSLKGDACVVRCKDDGLRLFNLGSDAPEVSGMEEWTEVYPIHRCLLRALKDNGFDRPTSIQRRVISRALEARVDIIGTSETGSGKTLAFALPILHQILEVYERDAAFGTCSKKFAALVLAPSRELALQIADHFNDMCKYTPVRVMTIVGGLAVEKQLRLLGSVPEVVVATPGRLWQLIYNNVFEGCGVNFSDLRFLVFDEADKMTDLGCFNVFTNILRTVYEAKKSAPGKPKLQTFVFSATMNVKYDAHLKFKDGVQTARLLVDLAKNGSTPTPKEMMEYFLQNVKFQRTVELIDTNNSNLKAESLQEAKIHAPTEQKIYYLYYLLKRYPGRSLVFVNAISMIKHLVPILNALKVPSWGFHATMQQRQRLKNIERFKNNSVSVLLSTDVLSRGLDIPNIDMIIHYQVPSNAEIYVHRCGRTARIYNPGLAITLVSHEEKCAYESIIHTLKRQDIPDFPIDVNYYDSIFNRVKSAQELCKILYQKKKKLLDEQWIAKNAKDLDVDIDLLFTNYEKNGKEKQHLSQKSLNHQINSMKRELKKLLNDPIIPSGLSKSYITRDSTAKKLLLDCKNDPPKENALLDVKTKGSQNSSQIIEKQLQSLKKKSKSNPHKQQR